MRASLLIAGIAALFSAQAASAQVIYQSIPDLTTPTTGQTCSPCSPTQVVGSQFSLTSGASVNAIQFVAGWYGWNTGTTDVQISIYKDIPGNYPGYGSVGDQIYAHDFTNYDATSLSGGNHLLNFDTTGLGLGSGNYLIFFTNTSILAPATYYGSGSDVYLWPDDDGASFTGFAYSGDPGETLGYALLGTQATTPLAAPEPASWAMMVAGFGLAGFALRRRPARSGTGARSAN